MDGKFTVYEIRPSDPQDPAPLDTYSGDLFFDDPEVAITEAMAILPRYGDDLPAPYEPLQVVRCEISRPFNEELILALLNREECFEDETAIALVTAKCRGDFHYGYVVIDHEVEHLED